MASAPNPLAQVMAQQAIQRLASQGGQSGAPAGQPSSPPADPNQAGRAVTQQLSQLQGSDPQSIVRLLQQVKSILVALYPRAAFTVPGVSKNIAQAQKYIDNAIKEAEQAATTVATVSSPIANSAGQSTPGLQQFSEGA